MNSTGRLRLIAMLLAGSAVLHLSGCSPLVVKPQGRQINRAAIVSLYANENIPKKGGGGIVRGWNEAIRLEVAENALALFTAEMRRIGWDMVPPGAVLGSPEYRKAFMPHRAATEHAALKLSDYMDQLYRSSFFSPEGMLAIPRTDARAGRRYYGGMKQGELNRLLASMARRLDVDAVLVIQLDYCYEGGALSLLGTGQAVMTAAASVRAVGRDGKVIVDMKDLPLCGGQTRAKSNISAAMLDGNLELSRVGGDRLRRMFLEANRRSARMTAATLAAAMQD